MALAIGFSNKGEKGFEKFHFERECYYGRQNKNNRVPMPSPKELRRLSKRGEVLKTMII